MLDSEIRRIVLNLVHQLYWGCCAHAKDLSYLSDEYGASFSRSGSMVAMPLDDFCRVACSEGAGGDYSRIAAALRFVSLPSYASLADGSLSFDISE